MSQFRNLSSQKEGGEGALVFKGGYDARTRKQVKRVVFCFVLVPPQQSMYTRTLKRVPKTAKFGKKAVFFNPWNCNMCLGYNHRLIKTQIGHARDFTWYRGQLPSPALDSVTRACTDSRAWKPLQLRDKSATLLRAWVVIVRHLDYILFTRAGDGRWLRYQTKSLACPGCGYNTHSRAQNKKGILNSTMHYLLV